MAETSAGIREKRSLGNTGIKVSPLCYGCASAFARDLISDQTAVELFLKAYQLGISFFDTGRSYGKAEARIGQALKSSSEINRDSIVLATKFDLQEVNGRQADRLDTDWAKRSVETSLKTMGIDYVDVLFVHEPCLNALNDGKLFSFFEDLKRQRIVKASGVNTFDTETAEFVAREKLLDVVMLDHNVVVRRDETIKQLHDAGIGVVAGQALAQGLFLKDLFAVRDKKDVWYLMRAFGSGSSRRLFFKARNYRFLNKFHGVDAAQLALRFVLDNPYVVSASFSACALEHLISDVNALAAPIPKEILAQLRK